MSTSKSLLPTNAQSNLKAVTWALVAVALFSFIYISGKLTGGTASAFQIILLRYISGLVTVTLLLCFHRTEWQSIATKQLHVHFFRAASGGGSGVAAIYAAANMPVADATAIGLLDGIFAVLLGILILQEVVSYRQWVAAFLCLLGAAIVVFGKGATLHLDPSMSLPATAALIGAILVAIESVLIKMLVKSENTLTVLFYVNLFGMILFALPGLWFWHALTAIQVLTFIALGPIAIIAQACNIMAFRIADVSVIGPVRYSWIIFGSLFGVLFFNEQPNFSTYAGGTLILVSGAWLATMRSKLAPILKSRV